MKVLLKLCKGLAWLVLILVLLAAFTLLAWWMQWPLITGAVIFLVLVGLFLAFFGLRALYRWHDKSRFVHKVMDEQASMEKAQAVSLGRLSDAWRQGMAMLASSPHRFHEHLEFSQPWFVVYDATGASSGIFSPLGETLPKENSSPLFWHFLSSSVLLHVVEKETSAADWQELLTTLAQKRRNLPLRGMVLLLSAQDISQRSPEELANLGRVLRSHVQQLQLSLNRSYSVYVLVEGIDSLPGMADILSIVPTEDFDTVLGQTEDGASNAKDAADLACRRLEVLLAQTAADGRPPRADMLEALCSLRALADKLHTLLEQVSRDVAHQIQSPFAGIAFCQGSASNLQRPAFLTGLLSYILPNQAHSQPLTRGLPFLASTRTCVFAAWLLLTLGFCALLGVNVLYQNQALTEDIPNTAAIVHDKELDTLYQQMLFIKHLEKARDAWYLPTFGQDAISRVIQSQRSSFTDKVYTKVLMPLLASYQSRLQATPYNHEEGQHIQQELMWLTAVTSDRIRGKDMQKELTRPFPMSSGNSEQWDPVTGRLIVNAIYWLSEGGQLEAFSQEMHALLDQSLTRQGNRVEEDILLDINTRYPAAKVCLSQFWPHLSSADPNNVCVEPAYTATGYKAFKDSLKDLEALDDKGHSIVHATAVFRSDYFRRYADLWMNFSKAFSRIRASMQEGDVFVSYTDISKIEDMPHYRAMQLLADQLVPLKDAGKDTPLWLAKCQLMDVLVDIASYEHNDDATSRIRALLSLVTSAPELMQRLRAETKDAKHARQMFEVAESIKRYFDDTLALLQVVASPEKSYTLAKSWFGGSIMAIQSSDTAGKNGEKKGSDTEDLFANAQKQLAVIETAFKANGPNPMLNLVPGMLDFIAQGVTVQAAKVLQEAWENEVLGSATALYRQDNVTGLFGDKGIVQTFVSTRLKPFLIRRDKILAPAKWGNIEFPFTTDGLHVLSQAEMIAAQPPEDTYYVQLRSQPTLVNVDARERVDATTLTLQCQDKTYTLLNRNYPREEKFQYTVKQCGPTSLEISFPSFTLKKTYGTFTDFLKDFQYGEREFGEEDFDVSDKMENAGVHSVTVRILPDNVANVLQKEGHEPPSLPDRLTYVW